MRTELTALMGVDEEKRASQLTALIKSWTERRDMMIEVWADIFVQRVMLTEIAG